MPPNDSWIACCFRTTLARILRSEVTIAAQVSSVVRACQRRPLVPGELVVTKEAHLRSSPSRGRRVVARTRRLGVRRE